MATLIAIVVVLGLLFFLSKLIITTMILLAVGTLWYIGEWWSYPLAVLAFIGIYLTTNILDT